MSKSTAIMLQTATSDGETKQQMVVFPDKSVFRRTITPETRTRWRYASVGDLVVWVTGYVNLSKSAPTPQEVTHGPTLIEVTEDEATEAKAGTLARNVGLRYARVLEAMDAEATPEPVDVERFILEWLSANDSDDNAWLDLHIHSAGTAKAPAPTPTPEPEPTVDPVVEPTVSKTWAYSPIVGGYITRPNGERYKVRKVEGVQDVVLLRDSRPEREHVFLRGEPGTGKTALVEAAFGTDLVTMLGTEDTEVSDFIGGFSQRGTNPDGSPRYGWTDGALIESMDRGCPLFVDECGVIAPKVMTVMFSVMDGRDEILVTANPERGTVKAKPGFMVIGATNPHAPGVRLSEALLSRFGLHMEVGTDFAVMREMGVPTELVTAAENLETRRLTGEISFAPQARELLRAQRQYKTRGEKIALRNLISAAPEDDREVVAEVIARTTGKRLKGLSL